MVSRLKGADELQTKRLSRITLRMETELEPHQGRQMPIGKSAPTTPALRGLRDDVAFIPDSSSLPNSPDLGRRGAKESLDQGENEPSPANHTNRTAFTEQIKPPVRHQTTPLVLPSMAHEDTERPTRKLSLRARRKNSKGHSTSSSQEWKLQDIPQRKNSITRDRQESITVPDSDMFYHHPKQAPDADEKYSMPESYSRSPESAATTSALTTRIQHSPQSSIAASRRSLTEPINTSLNSIVKSVTSGHKSNHTSNPSASYFSINSSRPSTASSQESEEESATKRAYLEIAAQLPSIPSPGLHAFEDELRPLFPRENRKDSIRMKELEELAREENPFAKTVRDSVTGINDSGPEDGSAQSREFERDNEDLVELEKEKQVALKELKILLKHRYALEEPSNVLGVRETFDGILQEFEASLAQMKEDMRLRIKEYTTEQKRLMGEISRIRSEKYNLLEDSEEFKNRDELLDIGSDTQRNVDRASHTKALSEGAVGVNLSKYNKKSPTAASISSVLFQDDITHPMSFESDKPVISPVIATPVLNISENTIHPEAAIGNVVVTYVTDQKNEDLVPVPKKVNYWPLNTAKAVKSLKNVWSKETTLAPGHFISSPRLVSSSSHGSLTATSTPQPSPRPSYDLQQEAYKSHSFQAKTFKRWQKCGYCGEKLSGTELRCSGDTSSFPC